MFPVLMCLLMSGTDQRLDIEVTPDKPQTVVIKVAPEFRQTLIEAVRAGRTVRLTVRDTTASDIDTSLSIFLNNAKGQGSSDSGYIGTVAWHVSPQASFIIGMEHVLKDDDGQKPFELTFRVKPIFKTAIRTVHIEAVSIEIGN